MQTHTVRLRYTPNHWSYPTILTKPVQLKFSKRFTLGFQNVTLKILPGSALTIQGQTPVLSERKIQRQDFPMAHKKAPKRCIRSPWACWSRFGAPSVQDCSRLFSDHQNYCSRKRATWTLGAGKVRPWLAKKESISRNAVHSEGDSELVVQYNRVLPLLRTTGLPRFQNETSFPVKQETHNTVVTVWFRYNNRNHDMHRGMRSCVQELAYNFKESCDRGRAHY